MEYQTLGQMRQQLAAPPRPAPPPATYECRGCKSAVTVGDATCPHCHLVQRHNWREMLNAAGKQPHIPHYGLTLQVRQLWHGGYEYVQCFRSDDGRLLHHQHLSRKAAQELVAALGLHFIARYRKPSVNIAVLRGA